MRVPNVRPERDELDRLVQEGGTGSMRSVGRELTADLLGAVVGQDRQDDSRRCRSPLADELPEDGTWERVLGDKPP